MKNSNRYLKYDDLRDEKSIRRDDKRRSKMIVDGSSVKKIIKIQKERFEKKYNHEYTNHTNDTNNILE